MREIKFRAWDKRSKEMLDLTGHKIVGKNNIQLFYYDEDRASTTCTDLIENIEIMQYTGLKDKNGVEIYEGDILAPDETCRSSARYVIEWNNIHCCFTSIEDGINNFIGEIDEEIQFNLLSNMKLNICEVIGNIYETPDLI